MPSRTSRLGSLTLTTLTILLTLGLVATATPALAADSPAGSTESLVTELDRQVGEARSASTRGDVRTLSRTDALETVKLPRNQSVSTEIEAEGTATFQFTVPEDDFVAIRSFATGTTDDPEGFVGSYLLKLDDDLIDTIRLKPGETDESWFPLPAGTYTIEYLNVGASASRTLSLFWSTQGLDLSEGQLTLPNNRSFETALPIVPNLQVHGIFYWGYNATSSESRLDGHYYEFALDEPSAVSLVLGCAGTAQIAMMEDEGEILEDADGVPIAASGTGSVSVDCGTLPAGIYHFIVITSDDASWKHPYTCEVFSNPSETELAVTQDVHRLYNQWSGEHLFTADEGEYADMVEAGWSDEGIAWVSPKTGDSIVYRLNNPYTGEHLYTADEDEQETLLAAGWEDEGVCWYSDGSQGQPVYRLFNPYAPEVASHHYTTDADEYDELGDQGWKQEGVVWYAVY